MSNTMIKKIYPPYYSDISITDKCNLSCIYCYANASQAKCQHMELKLFKKITKELENAGVNYIRIAGGEPLMHPQFTEILSYCKDLHLLKSLSTNATLLNEEVASKIKQSEINWVVVSLDGPNPDINDCTRGKFNDVIKGINYLLANNINTKLATVITSKNYLYYKEMIYFAKKMGLSSIGFILFSEIGRGQANYEKLKLSKKQLGEFIVGINEYKQNNKDEMKVNVVFPHESVIPWELSGFLEWNDIKNNWVKGEVSKFQRKVSCMAGIGTCAISAEGNLFGCEQMMGFQELCAGNLERNNFLKLWYNSEIFNKLRNASIADLDNKCKNCGYLGCGGGCRAIAFEHTNNILGMDPSCKILEEI